MKKVLIFGASGKLGERLIERGSQENLMLYAFARATSDIKKIVPALSGIIRGDVEKDIDVQKAFSIMPDTIIYSVGNSGNTNGTILSGIMNIIAAMQKHPLTQLLILGGAGILENKEGDLIYQTDYFPSFLKPLANEHANSWNEIHKSNYNYTYLCPPRMYPGSFDDPYFISYQLDWDALQEGVSYEACADFLIKQTIIPSYSRQKVFIQAKT